MGTVSAARLFSEAFNWFASLSAKLPKIDYKTFFIVVVVLLIGVGIVVGLTYFGSYRFKLLWASRKIIRYLASTDSIDDDNVKDFTDQCFSAKAPTVLCDSWKLYLGVRFGYPSDIVSESAVYDSVVKRVREVRASIYIGIALVLIAAFAFWGYGTLDSSDIGVIFCAGLLISGAIYILLVMLNRLLSKRCLEVFDEMQIELDAKVDLQVDKSYATDSSPLAELAAMVDEIIARNTAKNVGFEINSDEETPIEKLIANAQQNENAIDIAQFEHDFYDIEELEEELEDAEHNGEDLGHSDIDDEGGENVHEEDDGADESDSEEQFDEDADEDSTENSADEDDRLEDDVNAEEETTDSSEEDNSDDNDGESAEESKNSNDVLESTDSELPRVQVDGEYSMQDGEFLSGDSDSEENLVESDNYTESVESDLSENEDSEDDESIDSDEDNADDEDDEDEADEDSELEDDGDDASDGKAESDGIAVREIIDYVEDDEYVKPAKLVKLPNLVDYVIATNPSPTMLINVSRLMLMARSKFEHSQEDRRIVDNCIGKLIVALHNAYMTTKL